MVTVMVRVRVRIRVRVGASVNGCSLFISEVAKVLGMDGSGGWLHNKVYLKITCMWCAFSHDYRSTALTIMF